jgi:hypothetical protein
MALLVFTMVNFPVATVLDGVEATLLLPQKHERHRVPYSLRI